MTLMNFTKLKEHIQDAENIVLITGAGISTDSGLTDYKTHESLHSERLFSIKKFEENPIVFWKYFKEMFNDVLKEKTKANNNHYFVEDLMNIGKHVTVVTQNIDSLYLQVPNIELGKNYFEIHGNARTYYCPSCLENYHLSWVQESSIPYCADDNCGDVLRPDMVFYGEPPKYIQDVIRSLRNADLVIVIGTSFNTYPTNQLLSYAGFATKVLINNEIVKNHTLFDYLCIGDIHEYLHHFKSKKRSKREKENLKKNKPTVEDSIFLNDDVLFGYINEELENPQK